MKSKNLITKIALAVALAALVFAVLTLIRSIKYDSNVMMACILVVGTSIIVAICAIMLYVLSHYEDDDEDGDESAEDAADHGADAEPVPAADVEPAEDDPENGMEPDAATEAPQAAAPATDDEERDIEAEVDALIAELERKSSYDLNNFE